MTYHLLSFMLLATVLLGMGAVFWRQTGALNMVIKMSFIAATVFGAIEVAIIAVKMGVV